MLFGLRNEEWNGKTGEVVGPASRNRVGVLIQGDLEAKSFKSMNLRVYREVEEEEEVIFE